MAENGLFRVSFRGFDKDDVLKYIEQLKAESARRYADTEQKRAQTQAALEEAAANAAQAAMRAAEAETRATEAETRVTEAEAATAELAEQVDKLTALAKIYKTELVTLREQVATHEEEDVKAAAQEMNAKKIAELEARCQLLTEQNARYAAIVGDVNRLVVEARVVSGSYFDAAHQKSNECLRLLDAFLDELKVQTREAVQTAEDRHREGDAYMQTLLSDLKDLGDTKKA